MKRVYRSPQRIERSQVLIYIHIPKTAGISFRRMMKVKIATWPPNRLLHHNEVLGYYRIGSFDQRLNRLSSLSDAERSRIRYLEGHYGYGLHKYVPDPFAYLTLLREPMDRTISTFYHLRSPEVSQRYGVPEVGFKELMHMKRAWAGAHFLDNCQVRYLAGEKGRPVNAPFGECTVEMLEVALNRLERFGFVGLTGRFDESVVLLKAALGWRFAYYKRRNVNPTRPKRALLSTSDLELAREHNELDLRLYQRGVELFQERVDLMGPDFQRMVHRFRIANRFCNRLPLP